MTIQQSVLTFTAACDQPICTHGCKTNTCTFPGTCDCLNGYSGPMCDVPVCTQGCLNGNCSVPNTCFCYSGMSFIECFIFSIIEFQAGMGRCATSPFVVRSAIWHMPHARLRAAATAIQVSCLHPCQSSHLIANFQAGLDPAATRQSACPAAPRPMATASTRFQHTAIFIRFSHSHRLRACARTPHPGRYI